MKTNLRWFFALLLVCTTIFYWRFHNAFGGYYWGTPSRKMLVGTWEMRMDSREKLHRRGYLKTDKNDHRFILNPDGTSHFRSYTDYMAPDHDLQQYFEGNGTWKITPNPSNLPAFTYARVELQIHENPSSSAVVDFYFTRENQQLVLWNYLGDPDDNEHVGFQKTP